MGKRIVESKMSSSGSARKFTNYQGEEERMIKAALASGGAFGRGKSPYHHQSRSRTVRDLRKNIKGSSHHQQHRDRGGGSSSIISTTDDNNNNANTKNNNDNIVLFNNISTTINDAKRLLSLPHNLFTTSTIITKCTISSSKTCQNFDTIVVTDDVFLRQRIINCGGYVMTFEQLWDLLQ